MPHSLTAWGVCGLGLLGAGCFFDHSQGESDDARYVVATIVAKNRASPSDSAVSRHFYEAGELCRIETRGTTFHETDLYYENGRPVHERYLEGRAQMFANTRTVSYAWAGVDTGAFTSVQQSGGTLILAFTRNVRVFRGDGGRVDSVRQYAGSNGDSLVQVERYAYGTDGSSVTKTVVQPDSFGETLFSTEVEVFFRNGLGFVDSSLKVFHDGDSATSADSTTLFYAYGLVDDLEDAAMCEVPE